MHRNRIVFWQGQPSPHQSTYMRALADLLPAATVIGVFEHSLERERLALGWAPADLGRARVILSPSQRDIVRLASHDPANTVHIFSGLRLAVTRRALPICARTGALVGLLSEARHWRGWQGKLRILHSYVAERRYRSRVHLVLAIGHLGVEWFKMCGYSPETIFPWAYFVEKEASKHLLDKRECGSGGVAISFVGQCIPRKGIDTLLASLARIRSRNWRLQIIGDGPQRHELEVLSERLGVAKRVYFIGTKKNAEVRRILGETDMLLVPSRWDGWGAVVNEALMSGVPVVCSDYCGAADLVRASGCGELFRTESVEDLSRVLDKWVERGPLIETRRAAIRSWSKCIEGSAGARYLIAILEHAEGGGERPMAPWFRARPIALWSPGDNQGAEQSADGRGPVR